MKKIFIIALVALGAIICTSCNSRSGRLKEIKEIQQRAVQKYKVEKEGKQHNIVIRYVGMDKDIPADGQLLVIKCSLEDTVIVAPASLDDCRRILEENGKG